MKGVCSTVLETKIKFPSWPWLWPWDLPTHSVPGHVSQPQELSGANHSPTTRTLFSSTYNGELNTSNSACRDPVWTVADQGVCTSWGSSGASSCTRRCEERRNRVAFRSVIGKSRLSGWSVRMVLRCPAPMSVFENLP